MDFLIVPLILSRFHIERQNRSREQIVAAAMAAVLIGRGITDGHVHHPQLRIDGGMGPERSAAVCPRIALPCVVAELSRSGDSVELPQLFAGLCVVSAELPPHAAFAAGDPTEYSAVGVNR